MSSKFTSRVNIARRNLERYNIIGLATPKQFKELEKQLKDVFELENNIKEQKLLLDSDLKNIDNVKKALVKKINRENKIRRLFKKIVTAYLVIWLFQK